MLSANVRVLADVQNIAHNQATELEFNEVNFNHLVYEVLRLRRQRTEDLIIISRQKEEIIGLYQRLNFNGSPQLTAG
jgi:hypothetical protein